MDLPLGSGIKPGPGIQGGGAVLTVSPHRTTTNNISQTVKLSGWGPCLSPPGVWTECAQRTIPKDIQRQECPHDDDFEIQSRVETIRRTEDGMPAKRIVSPYVSPMPVPPADGPQLGPWQVAVVRVEETPVEDATKVKKTHATADRRRPIDLTEVEGNDGPVLLAGTPPPPSWCEEM